MNLWHANSINAEDNLKEEERRLNLKSEGILLWHTTPAVIVGRHQIIENEVNDLGIPIYRRITGGGAVYMDEGNINIGFIGKIEMPQAVEIVSSFLATLGLTTEFSGRNDILLDGKKFSGWASIERNGIMLCHGTLMFSVDIETLSQVLTPPKEKLTRHGISSVRARVVNLKDSLPNIDIKEFYAKLAEFLLRV